MSLLQKHFTAEVKGIDEGAKRVSGALVSSGSIDRDEEIILPEAWSLDAFRKNPIFLWAHAHRSQDPQNVLGTVENVSKTAAGLTADFVYDTDINPKAAMVFAQVQKGTIKGYSVGFVPKAWVTDYSPREQIEALPEAARKALESGKAFAVYTNVELVEISQVPVPSNPDALIGASFKSARLAELKKMEEETMNKPAEKAAETATPDIEAIVKAAVEPLIAKVDALTEQVSKLTPAPAEKAPEEDPAVTEAREVLTKMTDAELEAFFASATEQERADALALIS